MQAHRWTVTREREVVFEPFDLRDPEPGELVLRTEASLVSAGTELAIFTGIHQGLTNPKTSWPKYPQPMGYMAVGRVERVGGDSPFAVGQRLLTSTGHATHALIRYEPRRAAWALPDDVPPERLVFARMAKTAVTACCQAEVTVGQSVAVVGLGIIGQVCLRCFDCAGAGPLVGVDFVPLRRRAAEAGGASLTLDPAERDPAAAIRDFLPEGADIVIDATGVAAALPGAMKLARDAGKVIVLGSPRGTAPDVDFYSDVHRRSLKIIGAHDSGIGATARPGFPWTNDQMVPRVIDWVARGRLDMSGATTHVVPPARFAAMYDGLLHRQGEFLGVVIRWE